jgi:hypothetical protein
MTTFVAASEVWQLPPIPGPEKQCHSERGAATDPADSTAAGAPTEESGGWAHRPVGHGLPREKPRSTGCTVAEPDSSVGAPASARGKDHAGAVLRMTAILPCGVFPDSVSGKQRFFLKVWLHFSREDKRSRGIFLIQDRQQD